VLVSGTEAKLTDFTQVFLVLFPGGNGLQAGAHVMHDLAKSPHLVAHAFDLRSNLCQVSSADEWKPTVNRNHDRSGRCLSLQLLLMLLLLLLLMLLLLKVLHLLLQLHLLHLQFLSSGGRPHHAGSTQHLGGRDE
jgi:hypothetical protein